VGPHGSIIPKKSRSTVFAGRRGQNFKERPITGQKTAVPLVGTLQGKPGLIKWELEEKKLGKNERPGGSTKRLTIL